MICIEDYLAQHAKDNGTKDAIVYNNSILSYADLYFRVKERAAEYKLQKPKAIIIKATQGFEFVISYFAG